ncbi:EAL domain-containing protein [Pseudanabaena biceps]|nr:EAL domain-containing protein [Pseudanabaena biceps]
MQEEFSDALSSMLDAINRISEYETLPQSQKDELQNAKKIVTYLGGYVEALEQEVLKLNKKLKQFDKDIPNITLHNEDKIYTLLALIFARLKQSINLEELLETIVLEIYQLLQVDQVIVYRLSTQQEQTIEYEFVKNLERSLRGCHLPSIYTSLEWLESYQKCMSRVIDDIDDLDGFIGDRQAIETLRERDIHSAIATVIPGGRQPWGLIIVHQYKQARPWEEWEVEFLEKSGTQLAIAIHQMQLLTKSNAIREELDQVTAKLHYNQLHDPLTGLPNRESFIDLLDLAFAKSQTDLDCKFAVLLIDCERATLASETFGNSVGDQLLVEISDRLSNYRNIDRSISKIDSAKFTVLLENIEDLEPVTRLADQILESLNQALVIGNETFFLSPNIGIVVSNPDYIYANEILRDANIAVNYAKKIGRGKQALFCDEINQEPKLTWQLENDLRMALERQEFYLVYQPIVSIYQHQLTGFEVLLRWWHPSRGLITPQDFLSIAEETGEIIEIGYWVLENACEQLLNWQKSFPNLPPITISVNVSTLQVTQLDFVERIQSIIQTKQVSPKLIKLEITETMLMQNVEVSSQKLEQLRELGMQVYIDDFGSGYSSFHYLQNLPIDVLKIDRSFTNKIFSDKRSQRIVQSILRLATTLDMGVVIEGVETAQELDYFESLGGSSIEVQGFFISHPLDSKMATEWIHSNESSRRVAAKDE